MGQRSNTHRLSLCPHRRCSLRRRAGPGTIVAPERFLRANCFWTIGDQNDPRRGSDFRSSFECWRGGRPIDRGIGRQAGDGLHHVAGRDDGKGEEKTANSIAVEKSAVLPEAGGSNSAAPTVQSGGKPLKVSPDCPPDSKPK